jgi:hypothetical protein
VVAIYANLKQRFNKNIVTYLLKARTVEPEKQLLLKQHSFLGNGRKIDNGMLSVSMQ